MSQKQEASRLIDSKERYRALVTATSDVVYRMSADWRVMRQLQGGSFLSDTGEPIEDWMEKYIHPADRQRVQAAIDDAIRTKSMFQLEHQVVLADGSLGWTYSRAVPILDDDGEITEWFGAANDVTGRHRMEQALRDSKEAAEQQKRLYETITSNTPDLVYVFDLQYNFTYANEALLNMWGKTWDTAVGLGLRENGYEEWHAQMHEREIDLIRATKQPFRGEVSFPHATLGRRIYDYILTPVINAQGEVVAVAGTTRDITDIRNAESAISESEMRFRNMAEGTDVMIAVGDENGEGIYFNEAWTKATGRTAEELMRNGWIDLMHPDDRPRITKLFAEALYGRKAWQWEFRMPDKLDGYIWLLARGTPRFRSDGSFAGYISSTVDISEIKENEQRKNDFISMVSHELKTPLTSALTYVQVSKKRTADNGDATSSGMLDRTEKQLGKMARMINGFLNVSRLESGKLQMDCQAFNLAGLLKEIEAETSASVTGHRIELAPAPDVTVTADREKIGQVIENLIGNAVKYSKPDTTIGIAAAIKDDMFQVSVADQGIGISEDDLPRLFDRFYRVKDADARHISGFGIGLYLCAEIVKEHGGRIWAESTVGEGSTFYFAVPVACSCAWQAKD